MKLHSLIDSLIPLASLILILNHILLLKLPHPLNLIEINHEALLVSMIRLDTLPAENREMIRAIKMLDSLRMLLAKLITQSFLILIIKVKISLLKNRIFLNNLIENVYVQRKSLCTFQLLDQLPTNWASNSIFVMELLNAASAERMSTVNQYARDSLPNVILEPTELANVELPGLVVQIHYAVVHYF